MRLFQEYLDPMLIQEEGRSGYLSRSPWVWPSEASAELFDQREARIVGKCHRQSFFRLIGVPTSNQVSPKSARRFRTGRACEKDIIELCKLAGLFVASGVRIREPEILLSYEIDAVIIDPKTGQLYVLENKSVYGYGGKETIKNKRPKIDGVMQTCLYLNEVKDGATLKTLIRKCFDQKRDAEAVVNDPAATAEAKAAAERILIRNRIEVDFEKLEKGSDGPLKAKMAYESRDECDAEDMDISLTEDPLDGMHYPTIDGEPHKAFVVESIYERYQVLQGYYRNAIAWADAQLREKGLFEELDTADKETHNEYWKAMEYELQSLPFHFWPPAEFEWRYTNDKIESLFAAGILGKTKYNDWKLVLSGRNRKAREIPVLGAWQCSYCSFKGKCVAQEYPDYGYMAFTPPPEEESEAA